MATRLGLGDRRRRDRGRPAVLRAAARAQGARPPQPSEHLLNLLTNRAAAPWTRPDQVHVALADGHSVDVGSGADIVEEAQLDRGDCRTQNSHVRLLIGKRLEQGVASRLSDRQVLMSLT
jgi:hypothetical protein